MLQSTATKALGGVLDVSEEGDTVASAVSLTSRAGGSFGLSHLDKSFEEMLAPLTTALLLAPTGR